MKRMVRVPLGDLSDIIAWYIPETYEIVELYHELPMEGSPPTASTLTNISAMLPAIRDRKPPFTKLESMLHKAILEREAW